MAKSKSKNIAAEVAPKAEPDRDWEGEQHARTIMDAHEIMADPEKMKKAKKHLQAKKKAMRSVDDLLKYRNEKYGGKNADPNMVEDEDHDDV